MAQNDDDLKYNKSDFEDEDFKPLTEKQKDIFEALDLDQFENLNLMSGKIVLKDNIMDIAIIVKQKIDRESQKVALSPIAVIVEEEMFPYLIPAGIKDTKVVRGEEC